jgi:hypothetical protein
MATTRFSDHLLEGDHASRPAATDIPQGTLYSCTTHSLIYQSDGSTWSTWATLGGSSDLDAIITASSGQDIADALAGAAAPAAGNVFATMADVGAGGVSWTQDVNENGASFANFTAAAGTWASDGTTINQTNTAGSNFKAKYNTAIPLGFGVIYEAEIRFPTAGQGGGANIQGGLVIGFDGTNTNGLSVILDRGTGKIDINRDGVAQLLSTTTTVNLDTYYKLRLVLSSEMLTVYKDGTIINNFHMGNTVSWIASANFLGLMTLGSLTNYRNIKAWTLSGGAPA